MKNKEELISFFKDYKSQNVGIWGKNENDLANSVLSNDISNFLNWNVLLNTMVVGNKFYVQYELEYLQSLPNWHRWREAIFESDVGNPILYRNTNSSGNTIHQACHAALFEKTLDIDISELDYIFEFGGGYGCMCRLIHNLGFKGKYIIFDFPSFNKLQEYYLKETKIYNENITFLSQIPKGYCEGFIKNSLFLATWSFSEAPKHIRQLITIEAINPCQYSLFAYQKEFEGIDNKTYFNEMCEQLEFDWYESEIEYLPGSVYLFGER